MKKLFTIAFLAFFTMQAMAQRPRWQKQNQRARQEQSNRNYGRSLQGTIYGSGSIQTDQRYYSDNQQYYFTFQGDGNLVVYRATNNQPIWSSGTNNRGVNRCEFQRDGNLVMTDTNGRIVWDAFANQYNKGKQVAETSTNRRARAGRNALIMQNDGNLVIYSGNGAGNTSVKWATDSDQ